MKFQKALSLLLAILMLLGTAVLFASCSGEEEDGVVLSGDRIEVDVTDYAVVYVNSQAQTRTYKNMITDFAKNLAAATGERFVAKVVTSAAATASGKEILIGNTGRAESTQVLSDIEGQGYAVAVVGQKIVITGTSDILTLQALIYFQNKYLTGDGTSAVLTIYEEAKAEEVPMVTVATSEKCEMSFVYSENLYDSKRHPVDLLINTYAGWDMRDLPVTVIDNVVQKLMAATGLKQKAITVKKDSKEVTGPEFLVSITNRKISKDCLMTLGAGDYGFFVKDGQIVMTAYCDAALLAIEEYCYDLIKEASVKDAAGKVTVAFPEGFKLTGLVNENWVTDFPKPDGLELYSTLDTSENSLQYVYMGEGVNADAFDSYVEKLKTKGYRVITENEIEGSLFATLVNDEAKKMLYVAYNAYAHQDEYAFDYEPILRIVSSPTDTVAVPDASILKPDPSYTKVTTSSVTANELVGQSVGMGYIVTLEDGSFVIFDGGNAASGYEADNIWKLLNAHYERIYGVSPAPSNPLHIAAWVVTHSHGDHYSVFNRFISTYASRSDVKFDYLIGNYPSQSSVYCIYNGDIGCMSVNGAITSLQQKVDFTFLKVHAGQKYYFANLEVEVLMTYDDLAPARIKNQNDTSTVLRFTMQATNKNGKDVGDPYTMIWTGDANNQQSRFMCAMYGDYLKSDMVQVAHHGNIGCESDFYDSVNATVVWFPHSLAGYRGWLNPAGSTWVHKVDYRLVNENPNTKYVYVSGGPDANGAPMGLNLTLPFGDDGLPDYEKIYNTLEGVKAILAYTDDTVGGGVAIKPPHSWQ